MCRPSEGSMAAKRLTSIQVTMKTRDRLYWLKFRKTYDEFINELMDIYEEAKGGELGFKPGEGDSLPTP